MGLKWTNDRRLLSEKTPPPMPRGRNGRAWITASCAEAPRVLDPSGRTEEVIATLSLHV